MTGFPDRRDSSETSKPAVPWAEALRDEFAGLSVLITGHTGFKGSWLTLWLRELGATVTGFALDPPTVPNNYEASAVAASLRADYRADLRDRAALDRAIRASRPDVIFHLAAQSVVLEGFAEPAETFSVNVLGTAVLLDALRATGQPCAVVVVTSDKCYANDESGRSFEEDDPLGGHDPYSASKAGTELVAQAYRDSFFPPSHVDDHGVAIATARAGNVIGGGDWTAHGVVADIVRSVVAGQPVRLRNPSAIRPWQHVLEPLSGYLTVAARLRGPDRAAFCRAWNFGPDSTDEATVRQLTELVLAAWGAGSWEDGSQPDDPPEAAVLRLSTRRASEELGWHPRWRLSEAVHHTVRWYQRFADKPSSARANCMDDIDAYVLADARSGEPADR